MSLASCSSISCYLMVFTSKTFRVQISLIPTIELSIYIYIYKLIQIVKIGLILLTPNSFKNEPVVQQEKYKPSLFMNLASQ